MVVGFSRTPKTTRSLRKLWNALRLKLTAKLGFCFFLETTVFLCEVAKDERGNGRRTRELELGAEGSGDRLESLALAARSPNRSTGAASVPAPVVAVSDVEVRIGSWSSVDVLSAMSPEWSDGGLDISGCSSPIVGSSSGRTFS